MGNEVAQAIGRGLASNERLEELWLRNNNIGESGLGELIEAFQQNKLIKLKLLDLSSNQLNEAAGVKLASACNKVVSLE